jgi:dethiobiotin synthetase
MNLFVTAIDTNVGKTVVSALLVEQLGWNYWKPVQSGIEDGTDTQSLKNLVTRKDITYYPEAYRLTQPLSPHAAAKIDGVDIKLENIQLPQENNLIIEGAGGIMVPLNDSGDCIIDLIRQCNCEVLLVSRNYLGSINHTLLTLSVLKQHNLPVKGIIMIGASNPASETIITKISNCPIIYRMPQLPQVNAEILSTLEKISL